MDYFFVLFIVIIIGISMILIDFFKNPTNISNIIDFANAYNNTYFVSKNISP
jgi:hypothetical protein